MRYFVSLFQMCHFVMPKSILGSLEISILVILSDFIVQLLFSQDPVSALCIKYFKQLHKNFKEITNIYSSLVIYTLEWEMYHAFFLLCGLRLLYDILRKLNKNKKTTIRKSSTSYRTLKSFFWNRPLKMKFLTGIIQKISTYFFQKYSKEFRNKWSLLQIE